MVKYYKPADVQADVTDEFFSGSNTAYFPQWIGREIVAFGRTGEFPAFPLEDWQWNGSTGILTFPNTIFQPLEKFHAEFALVTDATQDFTDVVDPGTDITQYFHVLKYSIKSWRDDDDTSDAIFVNRRCRAEFGGGSSILFNGERSSGIVYLPLPELTIDEGIPVAVYLNEATVISGKVKQYRKGLFNERLWL